MEPEQTPSNNPQSQGTKIPFRKKLVIAASALFLLSIVFPPTRYGSSERTVKFLSGWEFIADMKQDHSLNWGVLLLEWVLLAGICWVILYVRADKSSE